MMQNWQKVTIEFWHRVKGGNRNLECPVLLLEFRFWYFKINCNVN